MHPANRLERRIQTLLELAGSAIARRGVGQWEFALINGKSMSATARVFDDWLILDAPVSDRIARADLWRLLQLNATLEGTGKFVMPDDSSIHIRAEIALFDEEEADDECNAECDAGYSFNSRVNDACAGLKAGFGAFHGRSAINRGAEPKEDNERFTATMPHRIGESGWPFTKRPGGNVIVDLDATGGFYQAVIEPWNEGANISVEVGRWDDLAEYSRQALGLMLLKAGGLLRLVRPAIEEQEGQIHARFDVRFTSAPSTPELDCALSSLSVACSMCAREAQAVQNELVAKEYLASTGHLAARATVEAMLAAAD